MKYLWIPVNYLQILIIFIWTALIGTIGMLLMLFTRNGPWVHLVSGIYLWAPVVCLVTGVRVKLIGKEKIDESRPCIYVANHCSHFDIVALARVMPIGLFFVAKKELAAVPFLGWYMRFIGHIFVDRKNKEMAMKSMQIASDKIKAGKNVISFPEGTRSKTGALQIFRRGSFIIAKEGQIDVVPVAISGSRAVLPSGSFSIRPGKITVMIGDRLEAKVHGHLSTEELASLAQEKVRVLLEKNKEVHG